MPKKPPPNPFFYFMKEMQEELRDQGKRVPSMKEMPVIANPLWKELTPAEKAPYEDLAKRFRTNRTQTDDGRFTSDGIPIQYLQAQEKEAQDKQSAIESAVRSLITTLPTTNVISQTSFFVMGFNILVGTYDELYLPNEVGIIEYSVESGIKNSHHKFIDPGQIPVGYTCEAKLFSESTHQIPISGFALATAEYGKVYTDIKRFLEIGDSEETRFVFCHPDQVTQYQKCLDWLKTAARSHTGEKIIFANLALLVYEMRKAIFVPYPFLSSANDAITSSAFDYSPNSRCDFHEEQDNKYCALGYCKRLGYILSDNLCTEFNIELTHKHFPERPPALEATTWHPKGSLRPIVNRIDVPLKPIIPHIPTTIVTNVSSQFAQHDYDDDQVSVSAISDISSINSSSFTLDNETFPSISDRMSTLSVASSDSAPSFRSLPANMFAPKQAPMRRPRTNPEDFPLSNSTIADRVNLPGVGRGYGLGRGRGLAK